MTRGSLSQTHYVNVVSKAVLFGEGLRATNSSLREFADAHSTTVHNVLLTLVDAGVCPKLNDAIVKRIGLAVCLTQARGA